jgi:putative transposase
MARLPRLDLADRLHLVIQRGRAGHPIFADDEDRRRFLQALLDSSREWSIAIHAYALMDDQVLLLATPSGSDSLSRFVQAVGRRYVKAYNHRHARNGPLWAGRYCATVIDPATRLMSGILLVEQAPVRAGLVAGAADWPWSSGPHHAGRKADAVITEHDDYWKLGNTPFEREARYVREASSALDARDRQELLAAALRGWPAGPERFLLQLAEQTGRPVRPRQRGRPRITRA